MRPESNRRRRCAADPNRCRGGDRHCPPAGDAVAEPRDPTQLLCVQVQQVPGPRMFIAVHQRRGAQAAPTRQAGAT